MRKILAVVACATAVSGCVTGAGVPSAVHFPDASQELVLSAQHWQVIAGRTADQLRGALPEGARVRVAPPTGDAVFSAVFADLLGTAVVSRGHPVVTAARPVADAEVRTDVRVVRHARGDVAHPGALTLLGAAAGAAVWVAASDPAVAPAAAPVLGAGLGLAAEAAAAVFPPAPNTEIVVTTALAVHGADVARRSEVFYVRAADADKYAPPVTLERDVPLQGR